MIALHRTLRASLVATVSLALPLFASAADATALRTPCSLHLEGVFSDPGTNHMVGALFDRVPSEARPTAVHPNDPSSHIFYQLPTSENEYRQIFLNGDKKKDPTRAELDEMTDANQYLAKRSSVAINNIDIHTLDQFTSFLRLFSEKHIILVGHNQDGQFAFRSGYHEDLAMLERSCEQAAKKCIFISCRSKDYLTAGTSVGVEHDLTLKQGIDIATSIHDYLAGQHGPVSDIQIAHFIDAQALSTHRKYHVVYLALAGCSTIAGVIVIALVVQSVGCSADKNSC